MKVKKDIFGITKGRRFFEKLIWLLVAISCILGVIYLMNGYVKDRTETISIVRSASKSINRKQVIDEYDITEYQIIKREFDGETMFKWEEREEVIGKFASYYIRENTPIYKDVIHGEKRYKNEWLYTVEEGQEILTIPFDYRIAGGNILLPGDHVKIRAYYNGDKDLFNDLSKKSTKPDFSKNNKQWNAFQLSNQEGEAVQVVTLFDDIEVIDMLSNGESIYEKYLELKNMTEDERYNKLKDKSFAKTIIPEALIVVVNSSEARKYLQAIAAESKLVITILPRDINDTVLDKVELIEDISDDINRIKNDKSSEGE